MLMLITGHLLLSSGTTEDGKESRNLNSKVSYKLFACEIVSKIGGSLLFGPTFSAKIEYGLLLVCFYCCTLYMLIAGS